MIPLLLKPDPSMPLKVMCLGAHCDDIEIGCGGTLLALRELHPQLEMRWLVPQWWQTPAPALIGSRQATQRACPLGGDSVTRAPAA